MLRALLLAALLACSADDKATPTAAGGEGPFAGASEIVFRYKDSSVPPEYHRSWVVTITPTSIRKVVDSYGKVISDDQKPLDQARFASAVQALEKHGFARRPAAGNLDGCSGGTSYHLTVKAGARSLLDGSIYRCGGQLEGDLAGDVEGLEKDVAPLLR